MESYTIVIPVPETTHINSAMPDNNYGTAQHVQHGVNNKLKPAAVWRELDQVQLLEGRPWLADMDIMSAKLRRIGVSSYGATQAYCRRCMEEWTRSVATWNSPRGGNSTWPAVYWAWPDQVLYDLPSLTLGDPWDLVITDLVIDAIADRAGHLSLVSMLANETGTARADAVTESGEGDTTMPVVEITFDLPDGCGYEIYCKAGLEAEPGVDEPVAWAAPTAAPSLALDEAALGLQPNATYIVSIVAVNECGRASTWPTFTFDTDASGHPQQIPSPVRSLTATARPGGKVDLRWTYDELTSLAIAEDFEITAAPLSGQVNPDPATVAHRGPRRDYRHSLTLAEGAWRIHVYARRLGLYRSPVCGVDVRVDLTPPTGTVIGLTASDGGG